MIHEHQWSTAGGYDDTSCDTCGVLKVKEQADA